MADFALRLYGPDLLGATAATLYTVPADEPTVLRYMRITNTSGNDRSLTMSIGPDTTQTRIFAAMWVPANGSHDWSGFIPLAPGEYVQAWASAAAALSVILAGVVTV